MALVDQFLEEMVKRGGSDLHLAANQPPIARVRGELVVLRDMVLAPKELEELLLELVTPAQRMRLAADLDLDLSYPFRGSAHFRAHYYVRHTGIAATFRLVPGRVPSLQELGCPEVLWRLADRRHGLVLVAGPASNGKTTTSAAMIDHINKTRACHIVTLENPTEFVHEPSRSQVTQREIGTHAPSFAVALKNVARENPDVVLVSDLSTREDVELGIRLASDGCLVLANVAASGVVATIERLLAPVPQEALPHVRNLLADCLAGVIAQHLVRGADGKTRIAVHEIVVITPPIQQAIREGRIGAVRTADPASMSTLDAALERLLGAGKITPEVGLERSIDKESFARAVARVRPEMPELTDL